MLGAPTTRSASDRERFGASLGLLLLGALACGQEADLPPGWQEARRLPVSQAACSGAPGGATHLQLSPGEGGTVGVTFQTGLLRCGQEACAYLVEDAGTSRLLVQPCDMHPRVVTRCACTTEVAVTLPASAARRVVELWLRRDDYGQTGANPPALADSQALRPFCGGDNPAQRCRRSPRDCLPSGCACSEGGWVCTADCGGGRLCADGGAGDPTVGPTSSP